jgi:hypothetical protein
MLCSPTPSPMRAGQPSALAVGRKERKDLMPLNIHPAKTATILILGTAGLAFTPHAQSCGEPNGQLGLAALALLAPQPEDQSSASLSQAQLTLSVLRAFQLWNRGQPKAAIVILEPLCGQASGSMTHETLVWPGMFWGIPTSTWTAMLRQAGLPKRDGHIATHCIGPSSVWNGPSTAWACSICLWGNGMRRRR